MMTAYPVEILSYSILGCITKHAGTVGISPAEILRHLDPHGENGLTIGTVSCVTEWLWEEGSINHADNASNLADLCRYVLA